MMVLRLKNSKNLIFIIFLLFLFSSIKSSASDSSELPAQSYCPTKFASIAPSKSAINAKIRELRSLHNIADIKKLAEQIQDALSVSGVKIKKLGTSGYQIIATYQDRIIKFETVADGSLSESLEDIFRRAKRRISREAIHARQTGKSNPNYQVFPDLIEQIENYHIQYQENYLTKKFIATQHRIPSATEAESIHSQALLNAKNAITKAKHASDLKTFYRAILNTPRVPDQIHTAEELVDRLMTYTLPQYQSQIRKAIMEKTTPSVKKSMVKIYNAFNSPKFDDFMSEMVERSLALCRKLHDCSPKQRLGIPDKYMAMVLLEESKKIGIPLEVISKYVGREPGRLYLQRIRRGSLMLDEGAPGNHGVMAHSLQNLFIYNQIGKERTKEFFNGISGWTYERMLDANESFLPIPSARDITRRHYWNGILKSGNREDLIKLGEITGEVGRYPDVLRKNGFELYAVEEIEENLLNVGSRIRAIYKGQEIVFLVDKDGAPSEQTLAEIQRAKKTIEENSRY